jgi:hypothetical protein
MAERGGADARPLRRWQGRLATEQAVPPSTSQGEQLLAELRRYRLGEVERGQVTVFRRDEAGHETRVGCVTQLGYPGHGSWWVIGEGPLYGEFLAVGRRREQRVSQPRRRPIRPRQRECGLASRASRLRRRRLPPPPQASRAFIGAQRGPRRQVALTGCRRRPFGADCDSDRSRPCCARRTAGVQVRAPVQGSTVLSRTPAPRQPAIC